MSFELGWYFLFLPLLGRVPGTRSFIKYSGVGCVFFSAGHIKYLYLIVLVNMVLLR